MDARCKGEIIEFEHAPLNQNPNQYHETLTNTNMNQKQGKENNIGAEEGSAV